MKPSTILMYATSVFALPTENRQEDDIAITNKYLFKTRLEDFSAKHEAKDPPSLDWSTDGCTSASDNPLGYNFRPACERHDFGYNNLVKQGRFDETMKIGVDEQFRNDLLTECDANLLCRLVAELYYGAVSIFGNAYVSREKRDGAAAIRHDQLIALLGPTLQEIFNRIEHAYVNHEKRDGAATMPHDQVSALLGPTLQGIANQIEHVPVVEASDAPN